MPRQVSNYSRVVEQHGPCFCDKFGWLHCSTVPLPHFLEVLWPFELNTEEHCSYVISWGIKPLNHSRYPSAPSLTAARCVQAYNEVDGQLRHSDPSSLSPLSQVEEAVSFFWATKILGRSSEGVDYVDASPPLCLNPNKHDRHHQTPTAKE